MTATLSIDEMNQLLQQLNQQLSSEHTAKWGLMNAQNMVEHLSLVFTLSTGKFGKEFKGDVARAEKMKQHFFAVNYPFPKSVMMPGKKTAAPPPLRCDSMEESKAMLQKSVHKFLDYYKDNPTAKIQHPYFGMLNFQAWTHFHVKHLEHHLMQFGLRPYPLTPDMEANLALIEQKLQRVYKEVTADHQAKWGMMNAHQMVEHLGFVFVYATGKFGIPFRGDAEAAKALWTPFTEAANPWKTVFPAIQFTKEPPKLRTATIEDAKKSLKKAFLKYKNYCMDHPEAITPHGFLGDISTAQWLQVHPKHIDHHLAQFGVMVE